MPSRNYIRRDILEPRPGERHDTSHSQALVFFLTVIAMVLLFLIWKRASSLKSVVQHRLRTFTSQEGAIRLPAEDGPPAEIFNEDEDLDADDQPLHVRQEILKSQSRASSDQAPVMA
ncbi:hypothetical protein JB92DRAFT_2926510 [Gautieria morchelliformis]|nr:hypothetical protein JB92DRAFT_2926510 [Gautieria morchelliformis]